MTHYGKGSRVRVVMFQVNPMTCLSGSQPKFGADRFVFDGTIRHIRGEAPTADGSLDPHIWVEPDAPIPEGLKTESCSKCGCLEVPMLHPDTIMPLPITPNPKMSTIE